MTGFSHVVVVGNLTRDPEIRKVPSGTAVADLGLATNEVYKNKDGEPVDRTCFVDVVTWGKQAEACCQYLSKGAPVMVTGCLQLDQWEAKDGGKRSRLRVRAERVQFLGNGRGAKPGDAEEQGEREEQAAPTPAAAPARPPARRPEGAKTSPF